jgi:outer membrane protein
MNEKTWPEYGAKTKDGSHVKMSMKLINAIGISVCATIYLAGCKVGEPSPFDPRSMGQDERSASRDVSSYPMHPIPTTLESPYLTGNKPTTAPATGPSIGDEPQVRLTLQEIIHRAVANSGDIKVQAYQPAIDETRVTEAEARFDPTFFTNLQYIRTQTHTPFNTAEAIDGFERQSVLQNQIGIRQNLESGGQVEARFQNQLTKNPALVNNFDHNKAFQTDFVLQLTQPLLRDFGNDINRARIVINRNNQRISLLEFRKQLEETIADIEKTYWDLVQAERIVRIQEDLVNQTIDTAIRLVARRGTDVTNVQISQTNAQLEQRRALLIRAKSQVKDLSSQLKRDMQDPDFAIAGPIVIMPAERALEEPIHFNQQEVVDTALANRFELGEQQLRVDSADTALKVGKNNLMPQLNAVGSIDFEGLGARGQEGFEELFKGTNFSYAFGLELEIPIGNRAARATYERALLQRAQAVEAYRAEIATVTFDCTTAINNVNTTWDELRNNRQAVFASQDALHGMEQREVAGEPLTPEFVQLKLQYQEQLAGSRRDEAGSISNYNQAIARVEQAKGTLLQYNNVLMESEDLPYERKLLLNASSSR